MRKLITQAEAQTVSRQHRIPCSDCPFRRDSIPGWLGKRTAGDFIQMAHGEVIYPCHTKRLPTGDFAQCAGMAIYRANVCKETRTAEALRLLQNKKMIFAWPTEFLAHHTTRDLKHQKERLNHMSAKESIMHTGDHPFAGIRPTDVLRIIYHGAPAAFLEVAQVKTHAVIGHEGGIACRVTVVNSRELRFYADLGPNRQTVLRDVKIVKLDSLKASEF